jgi:hypothetical protein
MPLRLGYLETIILSVAPMPPPTSTKEVKNIRVFISLNVDIRLQQVSQISLFNVIYFHAVITQKIRTPSEEKRKEKNIYNKII